MSATTNRINGHEQESAESMLTRHLPPQDIQLERMALGCALFDLRAVDQMRSLRPEMFYFDYHQTVFDELVKWQSRGDAFDPELFRRHLDKVHPRTDDGGWERDLIGMATSIYHAQHAAHYAGKVRDIWVQRQAIYVATGLIRSAHEAVDFPSDLAGHVTALQRLGEAGEGSDGVDIKTGLGSLLERWQQGAAMGVPTGVPQFDELVRLLPAAVYVIAGRPGQGKSALALAFAEFISRTAGVLFFSLEMSRLEILARLVSRVIEIPSCRLAELVQQDKAPAKLTDIMCELSQRTFIIDDRDHLTADQMTATARIHAAKNKLGLIVIDYCQLITPRDKRVNREQQIGEISRAIKQLSKQVHLPILLLSQMSREVEKREGRWPQLSDLRESGAIENDADAVIFIHNESPDKESYKRQLVVRKNRNGQEGVVPVKWLPQFTTFRPELPEWSTAESFDPLGDTS